jgi:1-deoxy-D-xylulose-5-phosphate reductoisomerase
MKGAIAYAMNWPNRLSKSTVPIDWSLQHSWTFVPIDAKQFPSIDLARHCGEIGGGLPAIFNAANEVAVAAFISKKLDFKSIVGVIAGVVAEKDSPKTLRDLADVSAIEDDARTRAQAHLLRLAP